MRIGDFVRVSFFFLSHILSFRSASLKTFERQIYIKQIRRHTDVQLDTPRYFRERLRKKERPVSFFLSARVCERGKGISSFVSVRARPLSDYRLRVQVCSGMQRPCIGLEQCQHDHAHL